MDKLNHFTTREECKEFLSKFNFEYYIPYFDEYISANRYYVELNNDKTKVEFCCVEGVANNLIYFQNIFYDNTRINNFQLAEDGESLREQLGILQSELEK